MIKFTGNTLMAAVGFFLWLCLGVYCFYVDVEIYTKLGADKVFTPDLSFGNWLLHLVWYSGMLGVVTTSVIYVVDTRDEIAYWVNKKLGTVE
jgi:hypothetical protein